MHIRDVLANYNSKGKIIMNTAISKSTTPWLMLFSRLLLFASIQAIFALVFYFAGSSNSWETSANWWPMVVVITNLLCVGLLVQIFQWKGKHYWDIFRFDRQHIKGDLLAFLGITVLAAPLSILPNIILGGWLFGDSNATLGLLVRPLPLWAVYTAIILFPLSQGMAEIATYFGYIMPSFKENGMPPWLAIPLPALMLGFQHIAVPLLFDLRFILWRGLMYIPFAFLIGIVMHGRPRMLPYFAIVHILMNLSFATMFLSVAYY
jgi:hypothetical protein